MSVRAAAIARQNAEIEASTQRAIAARAARDNPQPRKMTALESLSARLDVSPGSLQQTLMQTAFKGCSQAEFIALVIVSNTYNLNPLLREIYAFPKKGGGIQAIVGYDGWIKIANNHPQYDGFEADHIEDGNGNLKAIEGILHRKDRSHPTKKLVYLKEFKRNTEPWNNSPHHMLDVRCFCQTVRLGLGIPLGVEGIDDINAGATMTGSDAMVLPSAVDFAAEVQQASEAHDPSTGEVLPRDPATGMTEVDEETARALDADHIPPAHEPEGRADEDMGEANSDSELPAWWNLVEGLKANLDAATTNAAIKAADDVFV